MKRIIALILATALLLTTVFITVAISTTAELSGPQYVNPGDTITLSFKVGGNNIFGVQGELSYDENQVTLIGISQAIASPWVVESNGNTFFSYDDSLENPLSSNQTVFTAEFKVNNLPIDTDLGISCINIIASDGDKDLNIADVSYSVIIGRTEPMIKAMYYEAGIKSDTDVVTTDQYYGRMIMSLAKLSNNKNYVLSFDMKTTRGGSPYRFQWSVDEGWRNNAIVPASVDGNRYTFNIAVNSSTINSSYSTGNAAFGVLLFNVFMAENSAGYISNVEIYEADSNYEIISTENLASAYGDLTDWDKEKYTSGVGKLSLGNLMKTAVSGRVDYVAFDYFDKNDAKMMYYKANSVGDQRIVLRFPCTNGNYKLSFDLETISGEGPTSYWGHNSKSEYIKSTANVGNKYIIDFTVPSITEGTANYFVMHFLNGSEGYISNIELYKCDDAFNVVNPYNFASSYGDFSVWTKEANTVSGKAGYLETKNMDVATGNLEPMPEYYFEDRAMYYEVGTKGELDVQETSFSDYYGRMIYCFGGIKNGKKYVLSFDMKTIKGGVPWNFRWSANGGAQPNNNCLPDKVDGNRYYFNIDINSSNSPNANGSLLFNMFMAEKSAGYISNFELYEADNDYNVIGSENLADTFGDFKNWNKDSYTSGDGKLSLNGLMKTVSGRVDNVPLDYFAEKDAKMMYYKATASSSTASDYARIAFRFPSDSSSSTDYYYKLSFNLKTIVGRAPTVFRGHNGTPEYVELESLDGTKYTFNVKVPKISNGYSTDFSIFFPAGSEGYISNIEMYRADSTFTPTSVYNQAVAYGDFSVWTKDAQLTKGYVGNLQLIQNMDEATGDVVKIPENFFSASAEETCPDSHDYTYCTVVGNDNQLDEYRECENCGHKIYINNINGDSENVIDIRDLVQLDAYIESPDTVSVEAFIADLNGDGAVNILDIAVLRSRLLGVF